MRNLKQYSRTFFFCLFLCILPKCSGGRFFTPVPQRSANSSTIPIDTTDSAEVATETDTLDQIDFGTIFNEDTSEKLTTTEIPLRSTSSDTTELSDRASIDSAQPDRYPLFRLQSTMVRVALQKKAKSITLYSVGTIWIRSAGVATDPFRGRAGIQKKSSTSVLIDISGKRTEIAIPCTLLSQNKYNFIEHNSKSYRGAMIIANNNVDGLVLVNYLPVEDYLRGVLPLEIGRRSENEIEALKAQAVAARTYTYRRIQEREAQIFDLNSSVADQVYGGADVEYRESDIAVKMTQDLVLTYNDSLVYAYYHSTCGGQTASIEQVWNSLPSPYLVSIKDVDSKDKPFCSISPVFKWQEHWSRSTFTAIVLKYLPANSKAITGTLKNGSINISIADVSTCGRVRRLIVNGDGWRREVFGDKTRYAFRRNSSGQPILRSAQFKITSFTNNEVVLTGNGYGHGVGMCQMGSIGRARAGQLFDTILGAYYSNTQISIVTSYD